MKHEYAWGKPDRVNGPVGVALPILGHLQNAGGAETRQRPCPLVFPTRLREKRAYPKTSTTASGSASKSRLLLPIQ